MYHIPDVKTDVLYIIQSTPVYYIPQLIPEL